MKEITRELVDRDVVVCGGCGAVFEVKEVLPEVCPKCGKEYCLRWVTVNRNWVATFRGEK